jgi:hypothetical protein
VNDTISAEKTTDNSARPERQVRPGLWKAPDWSTVLDELEGDEQRQEDEEAPVVMSTIPLRNRSRPSPATGHEVEGKVDAPILPTPTRVERTELEACPLDELDAILAQRTVMDRAERTAVCLWIGHTYVFDRGFTYTPRLLATSFKPGSGKSALLRLVRDLSDGGIKLESGTTFAAIRDLRKERERVTLCLDQLDGTGQMEKEDKRLLNLLCSSCEVGAKMALKEKKTSSRSESFTGIYTDVGFPTALGKIGLLPGDAIMSRCIVIGMYPETEEERAVQMPERMKPLDGEATQARLRKWLAPLTPRYIKAPPGTPSRTEDIWQPLLVVAAHAGRWGPRPTNIFKD